MYQPSTVLNTGDEKRNYSNESMFLSSRSSQSSRGEAQRSQVKTGREGGKGTEGQKVSGLG